MSSMFEAYCMGNELGSCESNVCNSGGYERLQKSKGSLKDCFENVYILKDKTHYDNKVICLFSFIYVFNKNKFYLYIL